LNGKGASHLATRDAAYEDALTLLPTESVTAAARSAADTDGLSPSGAPARRAPLGFPVSKLPRGDCTTDFKACGRYDTLREVRGVLVGSVLA